MACDIAVRCAKTHDWRPCTRSATCVAETLVDGQLTQLRCCKQHKLKAVDTLIQTGPHDIWYQETTWRLVSQLINTHVRVLMISTGEVDHISRGTIYFGPMTKVEYLDHEYDTYHDEYSRIGMCGLHREDDECLVHMRYLDSRREVLLPSDDDDRIDIL